MWLAIAVVVEVIVVCVAVVAAVSARWAADDAHRDRVAAERALARVDGLLARDRRLTDVAEQLYGG